MAEFNAVVLFLLALCYVAVTVIKAAPATCPKPADASKALDTVTNNYMVVKYLPSGFVPSETDSVGWNHVHAQPCQYKMVETKKNPNQIPQSLFTAECEKVFFGLCDPRCKPLKYVLSVLERSDQCDQSTGQKIWTTKYVSVTVGYEMTY